MNVILITEAHSVFMAFDDASSTTRNCHDQIIEIRELKEDELCVVSGGRTCVAAVPLLAVAAAVANGMANQIDIAAAAFMNQVGTIVLSTNPKSLNSL